MGDPTGGEKVAELERQEKAAVQLTRKQRVVCAAVCSVAGAAQGERYPQTPAHDGASAPLQPSTHRDDEQDSETSGFFFFPSFIPAYQHPSGDGFYCF